MRYGLAALVAAGLVGLAGCGTRGDNPGGQVPVNGKVVGPDGKGVGEASLRFYPIDVGRAGGFAVSGADGTFIAKTSDTIDGLIPGKYKVTARPAKSGSATRVAAKYAEEDSTDLVVEVTAGQGLTITLK